MLQVPPPPILLRFPPYNPTALCTLPCARSLKCAQTSLVYFVCITQTLSPTMTQRIHIQLITRIYSKKARMASLVPNLYHPYPNEFAMRLGDWYWNQGAQKSRDNFKELLDIVGDPAFSLSAISQTRWGTINEELGRNHFDGDLPQWLGEDDGWKCSPITISVPFHTCASNPGCKNYTV